VAPEPGPPPDLSSWPFNIPAIAQIIAEGGFGVPAGITFLVGENGSGKSTLIEALAASYPRHGHWASQGNVHVPTWNPPPATSSPTPDAVPSRGRIATGGAQTP
jgi:energy-coupling factor transporter ATP-binding protein EcfA2